MIDDISAEDFFDPEIVRDGQIRRDRDGYILIGADSRQTCGNPLGGRHAERLGYASVRLMKSKRGSGYLTLARNIQRHPVIGASFALEGIDRFNEGWSESSPGWRWEHPILGAVQKQNGGSFSAETRAGARVEPVWHPSRKAAQMALWEHIVRERTLRVIHRPRHGVLASPEAFA